MPLWVAVCGLATIVANFVLAWLIASSLIIAAGLTGARLLRSRGSAVQSAIYRTTLVLAVLTPLLTWSIGAAGISLHLVALPVLPEAASFEQTQSPILAVSKAPPAVVAVTQESRTAADRLAQANSPANQWEFTVTPDLRSIVSPTPSVEFETEAAMMPRATPSVSPAVGASVGPLPVPEIVATWQIKPLAATAAVGICLAWFMVSSILLGRLALQFRRVRWLSKRAVPASDHERQRCQELAHRLKVVAPRLLRTPFISSPCLTGINRPTILLPDEFPDSQITLALVHELAHLARRDCLWNLIRHLATSLMWWQPLMWRLSQRIEAAAEEVCDDYAVEFGADRASYAELLLSLAEGSLLPAPYAAVPLVTFRSAMSQRVRRILDRTRRLTLSINPAALLAIIAVGSATALAAGLAVTSGDAITSPPVEKSVAAATASEPAKPSAAIPATSGSKGLAESPSASLPSEQVQRSPSQTQSTEFDGSAVDDDRVVIKGRVVGPDKQPVATATVGVYVWNRFSSSQRKTPPKAHSDAEGNFLIEFNRSELTDNQESSDWRKFSTLIATATGFGAVWIFGEDEGLDKEPLIQLVPVEPIEGRIIDLEGQPVAGADVRLERVSANASGDLTPWLDRLRSGIPWDYSRSDDGSGLPTRHMSASDALADEATKTDQDGRFRLNGVGRNQLAMLQISGKGIVFSELRVVTLPIEAFTCQAGNSGFWRTATIFGSRFEYAAEPSQPIEGVVRDAKTHMPIAGVPIVSDKLANDNVSGKDQLTTISDAEGRYRLDGMPKGEGNQLLAMPTDEQPYFMLEVEVPTGPGFEVVKCDFDLHRGVFITGRVTEKGTGDPIRGRIFYLPWPDNPHAVGLPEFNSKYFFGPQVRYQADADGRYRIVGLPGRGLIEISCGNDRPYPNGQGRLEIADLPKKSEFEKTSQIFAPSEGFPTAIKEVNVAEGASEAIADLELVTGKQVTLNVLDPQRQPIAGVTVMGHWPKPQYKREQLGPNIEILALKPDEKRLVLLHHEERNLGRAVYVTAKSANEPQTVVLEPCSKLVGRILDKDGQPVRQATLQVYVSSESDFGLRLPTGHTDDDGQIVGVTLFTGCSYHVMCQSEQARFSNLAQYLTVRPGEIIDLGEFDVTAGLPKPKRRPDDNIPAMIKPQALQANGGASAEIQSPEMKSKTAGAGFALVGSPGNGAKELKPTNTFVPASAAPSPRQRPEPEGEVIKVRGQVVNPEGMPVPNADVLAVRTNWRNWDKRPPIAQTRSDASGNFEIEYRKSQIQDPAVPQQWRQPAIVAVFPGLGPAWIKYDQIEPGATATLKLVRDEPIEGRIVDLEGHPVAGVTVEVQQIRANGKEDLSQWLDLLKGIDPGTKLTGFAMPLSAQRKKASGDEMESPAPNRTLPTDDGLLSIKTQTDADGRFRLTGVGRERVALLRLLGGGVAVAQLNAVTRKMDPIVLPQGAHLPNLNTYFGNQVQFAAEPSQPIEGVVRDAESGVPVPNVRIVSNKLAGSKVVGMHIVDTNADAAGHFRLEGMPKGKGNEIVVLPGPDQPYFARLFEVTSTDDLRPLKFDPDLHRGVWISGRVTDKESRQPVMAQMFYLPWPNNPNIRGDRKLNGPPLQLAMLLSTPQTDSDGAYRLLGMPGRGLIEVNTGFNHPYPQGQGIAAIADLPSEDEFRRVGALYAPTKDSPAAVKEIQVDQPTELTNVDISLDAGKSLPVQFVDPGGKPIAGVTVRGLWPPAQYREVNDAGSTAEVLALWPDEQRLVLVHHDERKLAKAVSVCFDEDQPGPKTIQLEPFATVSGRILDGEGKPVKGAQIQFNIVGQQPGGPQLYWESTDAEGRFKNTAVIPGCKYNVVCQSPEVRFANVANELSVTAGESIDLGDIDISAAK